MAESSEGDDGYILGYDEAERRRLEGQAAVIDGSTHETFVKAGISPGMRVLDVGCGMGNVSAVAAGIVGLEGSVVGVDRDATGFERAREIAAGRGLSNVEFIQSDLSAIPFGREFDAVVGRLVLLYFPDPRATLERLVACVRPGGVVAFQEIVWTSGRADPPVPSVTDSYAWLCEAYRRAGLQVDMADRIAADFRAVGLAPRLVGTTFVDPDGAGFIPAWLTGLVRSALPSIVKLGVATESEVELATLEGRMRREIEAVDGIVKSPTLVSCWSRVP